jgi:hypothetical protein
MYKTFSLIILLFIAACQSKDKGNQNNSFNRKAFLKQSAENIIAPAFYQTKSAINDLEKAILTFKNNQNVANLQEAQKYWTTAAFAWQTVCMFNFGPAGEMGSKKTLNEELATFPVSINKIENYILSKDISLANFDRDSRGLFGIEYLLFGLNQSPQEVLQLFEKDEWRAKYLEACIETAFSQIAIVNDVWIGQEMSSFQENDGTDIGSSISLYYNEFLKSYEGLKNFKFGIPLGLRPGQTNPLPQNVEGFYSGISLQLAKAHWQQLKNIWEGTGLIGPRRSGFKEYLESVSGGQELIVSTQQQMFAIDQAFDAIPDKPLSKAITEDFEKVNLVHTEMQKHTRFFKSDLSSLIGIAITYSSGDGD